MKKHNFDFHSFIRSLMKTIEARDFYTRGHSDRVADLSEKIAYRIGLSDEDVQEIHIAGHLHDIGKIGIPDGVLMKSEKLNNVEFELMKRHAVLGWEILHEIDGFEKIAQYVRCHHERPDGRGYPDKLTEVEIPLGSKIISVADAFDAMTSARSYARIKTVQEAITDILTLEGKQFSPLVVEAAVEVINKEVLIMLS